MFLVDATSALQGVVKTKFPLCWGLFGRLLVPCGRMKIQRDIRGLGVACARPAGAVVDGFFFCVFTRAGPSRIGPLGLALVGIEFYILTYIWGSE